MLNSKKWNSMARSHVIVIALFFCLLIGTSFFHTAYSKSKNIHVRHKKISHVSHSHKRHAHQVHTAVRSTPVTHRQELPRPVFLNEKSSTDHSLALVNSMHLAGTARPPEVSHVTKTGTCATTPGRTITSAQKKLVEFVDRTVSNINYSSYRLGGGRFDTSHGIYVLDCSRFVDSVLSRTYPAAYSSLVDATGSDQPASQHYYDFFSELPAHPSDIHWNRIEKIGQLRPGDILVFRYKKPRGRTQGHVMVIMDKPQAAPDDAWLVRVADSAPVGHSADTRQHNESGIGIGTLLLKPNATGKPAAYAWAMGSSWRRNVKFAMARPLKVDV